MGRLDYNWSDKTQVYVRGAFQQGDNPIGTVSFSPYTGFNTGQEYRNHYAGDKVETSTDIPLVAHPATVTDDVRVPAAEPHDRDNQDANNPSVTMSVRGACASAGCDVLAGGLRWSRRLRSRVARRTTAPGTRTS